MGDGDAAALIELLPGRCDDMRAELFLRVDTGDASSAVAARVTGTLTGPHRGRDTTLPTTGRLQPTVTPGVARALLTEPAYWTPDLPNLYRLEATIEAAATPPRVVKRVLGLRRLGVRGRSLWLDGRRWVPRAVAAAGITGIDACKPAALAAVLMEPDEALLARADEIGVAVLARLADSATDDPTTVADRIATWSAHASVAIAILPQDTPAPTVSAIAQAVVSRKGTLLLAATVAGTSPPPTRPAGIDIFIVALGDDESPHDAWRDGGGAPLVAWRRTAASPATGRAPCDALQASLAGWRSLGGEARPWDWAGYVVG